MNRNAHESDHPIDVLAEYARGTATDAEDIERHLAVCEVCRLELEIVRALAAESQAPLTDIERRAVYRSFEARRADARRTRLRREPRPGWLAVTWRAAAGIALLLTSVGVWRIVDGEAPAGEWNPQVALEGFRQDLDELGMDGGEVRAVLGVGLLEDPGVGGPWVGSEAVEPGDARPPWEEER